MMRKRTVALIVLPAVIAIITLIVVFAAMVLPAHTKTRETAAAGEPVRPFLLFSPEDLPAIRQAVSKGTARSAFENLKRQADKAVAAKTIEPFRVDPLVSLAFVWRVTGEDRYARRLRRAVDDLVAADRLDKPHPGNPRVRVPLFEWPLIYDIGYQVLSENARNSLRGYLARRAQEGYRFLHDRPGAPGMMASNLMLPAIVAPARFGLAIKGEPQFRAEWISETIFHLRRWLTDGFITRDGACMERGSYFQFAFHMDTGLTVLALAKNGYDPSAGTNADKWAEWAAYEITPVADRWLPVEDGGLVPLHPYPILLFGPVLNPDNPVAMNIASRLDPDDPGAFTHHLLASVLVPRPDPADVEPVTLPRSRHFRDNNQVHFRSDWGRNALAVSFQARWYGGHVHGDIGSFTLWSHGKFWAIDDGRGIRDTEAHNCVLVDGKGYPADKRGERSAGGDIRQFFDSKMASLAESEATDARRLVDHRGYFHGGTTAPFDTFLRDRRVLAVLWGDKAHGVPPYVLVEDDLVKSGGKHDYEWLLQVANDHAITLAERSARVSAPFDENWWQGPVAAGDAPRTGPNHIDVDIGVPADGDYALAVFGRGDDRWRGNSISAALDGKSFHYAHVGVKGWSWTRLPKTVALTAGTHRVRLSQGPLPGSARLKWVMLTTDKDIDFEIPRLINTRQTVSVPIEPAKGTDHPGWRYVANERPAPRLGVEFLNPRTIGLAQDVFDATSHARFRHPRLRAKATAVNPRFLVMLHPFAEGEARPVVTHHPKRHGFGHQLAWPRAVDYIGTRQEQVGAEGSNGNFIVVRTPLEEGENPDDLRRLQDLKLPRDLSYLMVNGTFLTFCGQPLVQLWDRLALGYRDEEERDRTVRHRPFYATVACSGDTLDVHAMTAPDARLHFRWAFRLRAFAPRVKTVTVNGVPTPFRRDGDHIEVDGDTEVFVPTARRMAVQVDTWYRKLLDRHPPNKD